MTTYSAVKGLSPEQEKEVVGLYRRAGWWFDSDDGKPALLQSIIGGSYCFCIAVENEEIIGIGRAIGDGICDAYIQDITVREDARKRGVGTGLVRFIVDILKKNGFNWIGLIAAPASRALYEKIGFEALREHTPMRLVEK